MGTLQVKNWHVKNWHVKNWRSPLALCGAFIASPVQAKTFVGVLWPMFGPLPAIGLVELVAELKMMPDVEVETYVHQAWPSLVDDLDRQPPGTHTVVVGYSLGANSSVFVANNAKHVDLIVALQPSMLSWNPPLTAGKVGRMIEIYNPNPWMTWGGMGSKKLVGDNIEYIANNDSHPGAQFNSDFRNLVKSEIAKFTSRIAWRPRKPQCRGHSIPPSRLDRHGLDLPRSSRPISREIWRPSPAAKLRQAKYWTCRSRPSPTVSRRRRRRNPSQQTRQQMRQETRQETRQASGRRFSTACRMRWIRETCPPRRS